MSDPINTSSNPIKRKKLPYMDKPRYKLIFAYEKNMVDEYNKMLSPMIKNIALTLKKQLDIK